MIKMKMDTKALKLSPQNFIEVSRIGYADEGLRLTVANNMPYKFHVEVQLAKEDIEWLIAKLQQALKEEENLP